MDRPISTHSKPQSITIDVTELPEPTDFTYFGSMILNTCSIDQKINNRISRGISRASYIFGQIKDRVYLNTEMKVNEAIYYYSQYSSETWTPYASQVRVLNNKFYLQCLRTILKITWRDKVTNNVVLSRCGSAHIQSILIKKNPQVSGPCGNNGRKWNTKAGFLLGASSWSTTNWKA